VQIATFLAGSANINLVDGTYSSTDTFNAVCTILGNAGGSSGILTTLVGNCTTPANVVISVPANSIGVYAVDLGETEVQCVTLVGGNGSIGLNGGQFAVIDVSKVHFGAFGTNSVHVSLQQQASYNILGGGGEIIDGGATFHWSMRSNAVISGSGGTSISTAVAFTAFLDTRGAVYLDLSNWVLSGAGIADTTGQRANLIGPGYLIANGATACNSFFPGNSNCAITLGFQDNANDALTSPWPAGDLPAPTASTLGGIESMVATAHQWIASIDTAGVPHQSQPDFSDLSGKASNSQLQNPATIVAGATCTLGSTCGLSTASNAISSNVSLNNTSSYFDGPSMAQGSTGTWFASGTVTLQTAAGAGADFMRCKLWDGTTIIQSSATAAVAGNGNVSLSLSGILTSPAGNIKISCRDQSSTSGSMQSNVDGSSNTATSVWGIRIN
jgi:hypothetical protein